MKHRLKLRWLAIGDRLTPALRQALVTTIAIGLYVLLMATLLLLPLRGVVALSATAPFGETIAGATVVLTPLGNAGLALLAAITFGLSVATGALCTAFFQRRFVEDPTLIAMAVLCPLPLLAVLRAVSESASQFAATTAGSNATIAAFLGFWALMLAYTIKSFWDEAKKRLEPWMTRRAAALDRFLDA